MKGEILRKAAEAGYFRDVHGTESGKLARESWLKALAQAASDLLDEPVAWARMNVGDGFRAGGDLAWLPNLVSDERLEFVRSRMR